MLAHIPKDSACRAIACAISFQHPYKRCSRLTSKTTVRSSTVSTSGEKSSGALFQPLASVNAAIHHANGSRLKIRRSCAHGLARHGLHFHFPQQVEPGAPDHTAFLRVSSTLKLAQDFASGSLSSTASTAGVFSIARRNRYQ